MLIQYSERHLPIDVDKVSQQTNDYDYGMYVCNNANKILEDYYNNILTGTEHSDMNLNIALAEISQSRKDMLKEVYQYQIKQYEQSETPKINIIKSIEKEKPILQDTQCKKNTGNHNKPLEINTPCNLNKIRNPYKPNKTRLNTTWQRILSKALRPPKNKELNQNIE